MKIYYYFNAINRITFLILCLIVFVSCNKTIIEKEIYKEKSNVIRKQRNSEFNISLYSRLESIEYLKDINDTIHYIPCDLNFDGKDDIRFNFEIFSTIDHDSAWVNSTLSKLNSDFEFMFEKIGTIPFLTPFYDTNNYISPSTLLWKHQSNMSEFLLLTSQLEECTIDNIKQLCIRSSRGNFTPDHPLFDDYYYIGFRFKDSSDKSKWHYGYMNIQFSIIALNVIEIAYESFPDKPILLRPYF